MKIDIDKIMSWEPCKEYTAEEIENIRKRNKIGKTLSLEKALKLDIPAQDVLWLVLRPEFISEKELHIHACHFAEMALKRERKSGREPHPASWNAIKVKRKWLSGKATDQELSAARDAARAVARAVAWDAAWDAARDATWAATRAAQLKYLKKYYKVEI